MLCLSPSSHLCPYELSRDEAFAVVKLISHSEPLHLPLLVAPSAGCPISNNDPADHLADSSDPATEIGVV